MKATNTGIYAHMTKRTALFLCLITFIVCSARAQIRGRGSFQEGNIWYHIESTDMVSVDFNGVVTFQNVSHGCYSGDIVVPETVEHNGRTYTVVGINRLAFYFCPINSIILPNTIKTIGQAAFAGCPITELTLPSGLQSFGESVFGGTKISSITIPSGIKELPAYLFKESELAEIKLPSSLVKMGTEVFRQTKITKISIPEGVTAIPERAFMQTPLEEIYLPTTLTRINDGAFQETPLTNLLLPSKVDTICANAFRSSKLTEITLPNTVAFIGENAFRDCSDLFYVNMNCPKLKEINNYTFHQCISLSQLTNIPDSVQSIGEYAFCGCADLQSVGFGNQSQLKTIGTHAFENSALYSLFLPQTVETISERAFFNCKALENVTYADGSQLKSIEKEAFKDCTALKATNPPNTTETIGVSAYENCSSLLSFSFPQNTETMEAYTFNNCSALQTLTFPTPSRLKKIKTRAFGQCSSLESLVLPEGLEEIGDRKSSSGEVFSGSYDSKLTYVYIPSTVNFIVGFAFNKRDGNSATRNVTYDLESPIDSVGDWALSNAERVNIKYYDKWMRLICVSMPFSNTGGRYAHIYHQDTLVTDYIIPEDIVSLRDYCFSGCGDIRSVVLPKKLKVVGTSCFNNCTALRSVTFGDSIRTLEQYAFNGCSIQETHITNPDSWIRLICNRTTYYRYFKWSWFPNVLYNGEPYVNYVFPDDITDIDVDAFYDNRQMQSVTLSKSLKTIGESAFAQCKALKTVTFPTPPESIGPNAFKGCTLQTVDIGDIAKWCAVDFGYQSGPFQYTETPRIIVNGQELDKLTIPSTVTSIANYAFYGCQRFDQLTITNNVTSIGDFAFYGCSDLTTIKFGKKPQLANIGASAFEGTALTSIQLPSSLQSIGNSAFKACKGLTEMLLPDGLISIGSDAFLNCSAMTSITMPRTLKELRGSFNGCTSLERINISDIAAWCNVNIRTQYQWYYNGNFYVDGQLLTDLVIPEGVDTIRSHTFEYLKELKTVTFPNSLRAIGEMSFYRCQKLDSIVIPEGVKSLGKNCFAYCSNTKYISLPASLEKIESGALSFSQTYLKHNVELHINDLWSFLNAAKAINGVSFTFSNGYEARLYVNGTQIRNLVIPEGITQLGNPFKSFNFIKVTLPASLETIDGTIFKYCNNLKYVFSRSRFAPNGTDGLLIGNTFNDNRALQAIYVPNGSAANYKSKWNQSASIIVEALKAINFSGDVSVTALTEEIDAHNNVYNETVPCLDLTETTLDETVTAEVLQGIADEGTVVFLPESTTGIEGTNIVSGGRTQKLILRDSTDFVAPYDFVADELQHYRHFAATRAMGYMSLPRLRRSSTKFPSNTTTMCLPYGLNELPQGMTVYELKGQDVMGNIVFEQVDKVEANMPYLVSTTTDIDLLQAGNVLVKATPAEMPFSSCEAFDMYGTLSTVSHDDAVLDEACILGPNLEWLSVEDADEEVYVPAGHVYLVPNNNAQTGEEIATCLNSPTQEATGEALYDLYGRSVGKTQQKGIYIRNGKKVLIK